MTSCRVGVSVYECMVWAYASERVSVYVSEWVNEWMSEWVYVIVAIK